MQGYGGVLGGKWWRRERGLVRARDGVRAKDWARLEGFSGLKCWAS